jgi:hypothetical protein
MAYEIISVTFDVDAQGHRDNHFTVPKKVCDFLKLEPKAAVTLIIEIPSKTYPPITTKLKSGTEIYGKEIQGIERNQRIRVTISRYTPPPDESDT